MITQEINVVNVNFFPFIVGLGTYRGDYDWHIEAGSTLECQTTLSPTEFPGSQDSRGPVTLVKLGDGRETRFCLGDLSELPDQPSGSRPD